MKSIIVEKFGDYDVLKYNDQDTPKFTSKQILIRTHATSINFADIKARLGLYHGGKQPPFIPGLDVAGTVEAVGSNVKNIAVGQRVIAFPSNGSYAEYTVADEVLTFPIPENIDFEIAAAFPLVSFTSYNLLKNIARIEHGDSVLIHAASGGVGTTAIQIAKLLGASKVIGTVSTDEKAEIVVNSGADDVINYRKEDFVEKVQSITNEKGVSIILDSLSGEIFEKSMKCLSLYGRIVTFGNGLGQNGHFTTNSIHKNCQSILGYSLGTTIKNRPETLVNTANAVIPLISSGKLKMKIGQKFDLKDAALAHKCIEDRKNVGKVILKV